MKNLLLICAMALQLCATAQVININGKSNFTISGKTIAGGAVSPITLYNCSNVHITKCRLLSSAKQGVYLRNCTNVLIDSCFITDVYAGVHAYASKRIRVNSNQFKNMRGPLPAGNFVQFNGVTGAGNEINYNRCEDAPSTPGGGDGIGLYQCDGAPDGPILVIGNWIRGGGTGTGDKGMGGIVAGDEGGSYQIVADNMLVNTGYVGIQVQGGHHITVVHNKIYSDLVPWSGLGLGSANYSKTGDAYANIIAYNVVNWKAGYLNMKQRDTAYKPRASTYLNQRPIGWDTNTIKAAIGPDILPAVIITSK